MRFSDVTSENLFEKAYRVADFYGFESARTLVERYRGSKRKAIPTYNTMEERNLHNLTVLLQFFFERSIPITDEPLCIFHSNIDRDTKSVLTNSKKPDETQFTLTVIGVENSYAEALILSCANHIFKDLKSKDHTIRINSMGTREDSKLYFSKLRKTVKKMRKNIQPECRVLLENERIVEAHPLLHDSEQTNVAEYIVPTLRLLSDTAREHFEQIIEYLEAQGLPYELAPDLVEVPHHGVHTTFEIQSENSSLYARGGRYDTLPYHAYRRKVPVTSITITLPEKTTGTYRAKRKPKKPKVFLIHAGERARLRSLHVLSQLCNANIPVAHRLHCLRVSDQLTEETRKYPFTIVFGQEEAENDSVCVRKTDTRASSVVHLNEHTMSDNIKAFLQS